MNGLPNNWFITLVLALCLLRVAGGTVPTDGEVHHGYGGFAITPAPGATVTSKELHYSLDNYLLWGGSISWQGEEHALGVSLFTVVNAKSSTIGAKDKPIVLAKWKSSFLKDVAEKQSKYKELPYTFGDSMGYEFQTAGTHYTVVRVFFIKESLFTVSLSVRNETDLVTFKPLLDSFRLLSKDERVIALIESFDPPPLPQERPVNAGLPETDELGLKAGVRRVRDTTKPNGTGKSVIIQQIHFDQDGFKTKEIGFIDGFPDLITAWGWSAGKRINFQSAVNYPGSRSNRSTIVSGSTPLYDPQKPYDRTKYGNTIETQLNSDRRPVVRKVFSNNGSLIYVETFQHTSSSQDIKTSDSSCGFISRVREVYDKEHNIVERQVLGDDGLLFTSTKFQYSFDEKGNWIERREVSNRSYGRGKTAKVISTVFRDILYYEATDNNKVASFHDRR